MTLLFPNCPGPQLIPTFLPCVHTDANVVCTESANAFHRWICPCWAQKWFSVLDVSLASLASSFAFFSFKFNVREFFWFSNFPCLTHEKHLIPFDGSNHQDISPEIYSDKVWCQILETLLFNKALNLNSTDINQFWTLNFLKKHFQRSFFKRISKKIEKNLGKNFEKIRWKNFRRIFWKKNVYMQKSILFWKIFENYLSENKTFENWSMAVWSWLFFEQIEWTRTFHAH